MAERLRRSTRMVWYHGLGCKPPGTNITLLSNSERSVGSIPTRRVLQYLYFCYLLMAQGQRERGKEEGERQGSQNLFLFALGCRRAERAAGANKFFFLFFCGAAVAAFFFTGQDMDRRRGGGGKKRNRRGEEHGAREETTSRGRFFGGERRGALERGSSAVSPTPFSRECLVRVLWGTTVPFAAALFWPFGGGWLRERKAAAWKTRKGKSRSQLEVEKKEETSLFVSSFHSLHPSFLVQQQQQQHETACSAPPLNFRMRPA